MSPLSIILLSPMKKWSGLNQERNLHRSSTVYKPKQSKTALNKFWSERQWKMDFFTGGSIIMNNGLMQLLTSQDINWWTGVVWITCGLLWCVYQLFGLSFWRHPFTAEHPLLSKWCTVTFLQIWWRNNTHRHLGWPEGEYILSKFSFLADL